MSLRYEQTYIQNPHIFGSINSLQNNINYHQRNKKPPISLNNNFIIPQKSKLNSYQSLNMHNSVNQLSSNNKVSYARNIKNRLLGADQLQQMKKQIQKQNYRNQLEIQMKADRERKIREKEKIQKQQIQRQRKFYAQVQKIKAQDPKVKQQPSYLIMRSRKQNRNKNKTDQSRSIQTKKKQQNFASQLYMPKIMKRGGYHNQSALDNISYLQQNPQQQIKSQRLNFQQSRLLSPNKSIRQTQVQQRQIQIIRERNYEQQRISNIIKLQQKMMRKLQHFKQQILRSNNRFNMESQVQQIRNILKAKPIKLQAWSLNNDHQIFNNNSDFYHFPKLTGNIKSRNRANRSRISQGIDLNSQNQQNMAQRTFTQENQQNTNDNQQIRNNQYQDRQIKLFKQDNDKNYEQNRNDQQRNQQSIENPQINIPVVLRNKIPFKSNRSIDSSNQ